MPQLISHRDGFGWQTPSVTDILNHRGDTSNLDRTGQLRIKATLLVRRLAELNAPVRMQKVESFVTHTRFHMQPEKSGPRGAERTTTFEDIQHALPHLIHELNATVVELARNPSGGMTLFLRTDIHKTLNLYSLLSQKAFMSAPGYTALGLGLDSAQNVVLRDLPSLSHLLVVGSASSRLHLQLGLALTLVLFNSPSYLRLALVGEKNSLYQNIEGAPHVLGNIIGTAADFGRLLDGLVKHMAQRKRTFERYSVTTLDDYNKLALTDKSIKPMPRIVVLLDAVVLRDWRAQQTAWLVPLYQILSKGGEVGLSVLMNSLGADQQGLPERIGSLFRQRVILRSALNLLGDKIKPPTDTPLQFMDGLLLAPGSEPVALEIPTLEPTELIRAVTYWQNMRARRAAELTNQGQPAPTGYTGLLNLKADLPTPAARPDSDSMLDAPVIPDHVVDSAGALAAYLGWLGIGPLKDVLRLSLVECEEVLHILQAIGVLEPGDGPMWRFMRLAEPPSPSG